MKNTHCAVQQKGGIPFSFTPTPLSTAKLQLQVSPLVKLTNKKVPGMMGDGRRCR